MTKHEAITGVCVFCGKTHGIYAPCGVSTKQAKETKPNAVLTDEEIEKCFHLVNTDGIGLFELSRAVEQAILAKQAEQTKGSAFFKEYAEDTIDAQRKLLEQARDALDYHVQQTRPIHSTTLALDAITEHLKAHP